MKESNYILDKTGHTVDEINEATEILLDVIAASMDWLEEYEPHAYATLNELEKTHSRLTSIQNIIEEGE